MLQGNRCTDIKDNVEVVVHMNMFIHIAFVHLVKCKGLISISIKIITFKYFISFVKFYWMKNLLIRYVLRPYETLFKSHA